MTEQYRRVTFKMYPTPSQERALEHACDLHRNLYNAALQERIDAWRLQKKSISFADQCKSVTEIRKFDPDYKKLNAQSIQITLKRLDEAFGHFFRRVKAGETPGFPRFKAKKRFSGFGFKTHGDGFRFTPGPNWKHGKLRLSGIGMVRLRGEANLLKSGKIGAKFEVYDHILNGKDRKTDDAKKVTSNALRDLITRLAAVVP